MSNIPKLRFPEFKGEWEEKKLISEFPFIRNGFVGIVTDFFTTETDGIKYIEGTNIHDGQISNSINLFVTKEFHNTHKNSQLKRNDILMVQSGHVGETAVVPKELENSNCHALIIMSNGGNCSSVYVNNYFQSKKGKKKLSILATGTTIKHILASDMQNFICPFPSLAEQKKIADFLSNVDSIITAETKILNTLQKKKKALMQKLFTQQLRFKSTDGTDFPAWEEKKLGECVISISSGKNKQKDSAGNYPVYGSMGIIGYSEQYVYNKDCILVARVGANAGTLHIAKGKYDVSDNTLIIELNENELLSFYYFLLVNINLNKLNYGTGQPLVTSGMLKNIDIQIPCKAEQQKIADCLSSMDSLIQTQQKVVTTWQQRKKALLQQMFI